MHLIRFLFFSQQNFGWGFLRTFIKKIAQNNIKRYRECYGDI